MQIPLLLALLAFAWLSMLVGELAQTVGQAVMLFALLAVMLVCTWCCGWFAATARHERRHPALPPRDDDALARAFQNRAMIESGKRESGKA